MQLDHSKVLELVFHLKDKLFYQKLNLLPIDGKISMKIMRIKNHLLIMNSSRRKLLFLGKNLSNCPELLMLSCTFNRRAFIFVRVRLNCLICRTIRCHSLQF